MACRGTKGPASVFYRPAGNASSIQEVVWDVERDQWSKGTSFNGVRAGSGITTVETASREGAERWLYGIASSGGVLEWRCVNCCRITATSRVGVWRRATLQSLSHRQILRPLSSLAARILRRGYCSIRAREAGFSISGPPSRATSLLH